MDGGDFERLVEECIGRIERDGMPALDALCSARPEHAAALRARMDSLHRLGLLAAAPAASRAEVSPGALPSQIGEFTILRPLGGGGMGVVYLARQESLGRTVALKLIRPEMLLFPGTRERFRREVETVARLDHPGIVPVYAVGDASGLPYFAMQWVQGCSLSQALEQLARRDPAELGGADLGHAVAAASAAADPDAPAPAATATFPRGHVFGGSYVDACLRIARQVADALEHAHRSGVIHRDVKPSNIVVTPAGRALLLDFGLAWSEGTSELTRTGARMGSLGYMAPEHLGGGAITVLSDVYALGVVLHEMLALAPAFAAERETDVCTRILAGDVGDLRRRNPAVPRDAAVVCRTAMALEPERRYARAGDFARDVDNVLDGRPVEARPASAVYRLRRWAARKPGAAAAAGLAAALLIGLPALYAVEEHRAFERLKDKQARIDAWSDGAMRAVDAMLARVGGEALRSVPQMEPVRRSLLEDALAFYREFLSLAEGDDPEIRLEAARVRTKTAEVCVELGDLAGAEAHAREAVAELQSLATGSEVVEDLLAKAGAALGNVLRLAGRTADARAVLAATIERAERRPASGARAERLSALHQLVGLASEAEPTAAAASYAEALRLAESVHAGSGGDAHTTANVAVAAAALGAMQGLLGDAIAAEASLRRAAELLERLVEREPGEREHARALARVRYTLSQLLLPRPAEAEVLCRQALATFQKEVADFPQNPFFQRDLNTVHWHLGAIRQAQGDHDEALEIARTAVAELRAAAERFGAGPELARDLGLEAAQLCRMLREARDPAAAREAGECAIQHLKSAAAATPGDLEVRWQLGTTIHGLGVLAAEAGQPNEALHAFEQSSEEQRAVLARDASFQKSRVALRGSIGRLALIGIELGDHARAAAAARELPGVLGDRAEDYRSGIVYLGRCAELAENDPALDAAERERAVEAYAAAALEIAAAGAAAGLIDLGQLREDPECIRLVELQGFAELARKQEH